MPLENFRFFNIFELKYQLRELIAYSWKIDLRVSLTFMINLKVDFCGTALNFILDIVVVIRRQSLNFNVKGV